MPTAQFLVCHDHDTYLYETVEYATNVAYVDWLNSRFSAGRLEANWDGVGDDYSWDSVIVNGLLVFQCPEGEWVEEDLTDHVVMSWETEGAPDLEELWDHTLTCNGCDDDHPIVYRTPWRPERRPGHTIPTFGSTNTASILSHFAKLPLSEALEQLAEIRDSLVGT